MREAITQAGAELRRAEHLLYVSLKYTRTVDVIKNVIERLIATFDNVIDAALKHAKEHKLIDDITAFPKVRITTLETLYKADPIVLDSLALYTLMKKISKAKFDRAMEYRRHVTMTAHLEDGQNVEVTIDVVGEYYHKTETFFKHILNIIKQ